MKRRIYAYLLSVVMLFGLSSPISANTKSDVGTEAKTITKDGTSSLEQTANKAEDDQTEYEEDEVIIVYKDDKVNLNKVHKEDTKNLNDTEEAMKDLGIKKQEEIATDVKQDETVVVAQLPKETSVEEAIEELEDTSKVAHVQKNYIYRTMSATSGQSISDTEVNDEKQSYAYYLQQMNFQKSWSLARADGSQYNATGKPITVAVIDTGINYDKKYRHEDLQDVSDGGNILYEYAYDATRGDFLSSKGTDWLNKNGTFIDYVGHGTEVASLISATANNGKGIAGVSYNGQVLPINVFSTPTIAVNEDGDDCIEGSCTSMDLINAYTYILKNADKLNIKVINMSLGGELNSYDYIFQDYIDQAHEKGILSIASAGNGDMYGNVSTKMYPASLNHVVSVGATDEKHEICDFSQRNSEVDLTASGSGIAVCFGGLIPDSESVKKGVVTKATWPTENYNTTSYAQVMGTSFSAPMVSGAAALIYATDKTISPDEVEYILEYSSVDLGPQGRDNSYGYGELDAYAAVSYAKNANMQTSISDTKNNIEITLSKSQYTYNGSTKTPAVTIKKGGIVLADKISASDKNFDLRYSEGRKAIGSYTVTITGKGNYSGKVTKSFEIIPKSTSITKLIPDNKKITVRWKAKKQEISGYQIRYSTKSSMAKAKNKKIKDKEITQKTLTGLSSKKKYYVQIRTYSIVSGKEYDSNWSTKKAIKTK